MELSRLSPAPARYTGIGIVIAVHVVAITALSLGFIKPVAKPKEPTVLLPPLPKTQEPLPQPQPPLKAPKPTLTQVPIIEVPTPPVWVETPNTPTAEPARPESTVAPVGGQAGSSTAPPIAKAPSGVQAPGAVCSVMPRPELPLLNWTGEAVLQVVATVRGGRVVGSEFRVTQGALDSKSRRALQRSVETALAGYQCQGDAMFQQDFAFRLD